MKGFAKIIELEDHDVLIVRGSTDEDGEHITMTASINGVRVNQTFGFEDDEAQTKKAFDLIGEKQCSGFIQGILSMMD